MRTRAAVVHGIGKEWEITDLELDPPQTGEVRVRFAASGLCHSDESLRNGDLVPRFPMVGGHEGAGVIEDVGPGVTRLAVGDHVICSVIPVCGRCRFCATGMTNLCDLGATILDGRLPSGGYRWHKDGEDYGGMDMLGTFSECAVLSEYSCVKIDEDLPLEVMCLIGCGVPTGWGTAVRAGDVRPGETVVVYGIGGIGINAVQGAAFAGAREVVAVDPLANKREAALKFGATHAVATAEEAYRLTQDLTRGVGAEKALVTVGVVTEDTVQAAFTAIAKGGTVVVTGLAAPDQKTIHLPGAELTLFQKRIQGNLIGATNPFDDIPRLTELYRSGDLKLDELITRRYSLDEVGQGYRDLLAGEILRGVIVYS
jgi:alcohol dehydrogenase (nicotinoprotein)